MSCPDCIKGEFLPGEPKGSIDPDYQGAYFTPGTGEGPSKRAVVLLTDAFGLPLKNCKIIADELASRLQCDVWVPDYFNGRPLFPVSVMVIPDRAGIKLTIWDWIKFFAKGVPHIPSVISSRPSVADKRVKSFIELIKEKKKYEKLGAVGYCYGGSTCVRLGGTGLVDSVVIAHPGGFSIAQVTAIKVPAAWVCAEGEVLLLIVSELGWRNVTQQIPEDFTFSPSLRRQSEAIFAARRGKEDFVEYEFKEYKGTAHGFASRPNLALPEIKEAQKAALDQTVEWFKKTLA